MHADITISYFLKLQLIIILSTYKAKYVTLYKVEKNAVWLGYLLAKLKFQKNLPLSYNTLIIKDQLPSQINLDFIGKQNTLTYNFT